jgi:alcohol dehydrogenase
MQEFFEFSLGARVLYKRGLAYELGDLAAGLGAQRAFIIADHGVAAVGLLEPVIAGLQKHIEVVGAYTDVPANSSVESVMEAASAARDVQADLVVAVGGGSPIDTAKAVRIVLTHGGHLLDYQGYHVIDSPLVPMIVVPTTAGTGSEVTTFAVIRDHANDLKITFSSHYLVPNMAVLDPAMTVSLPPRLTAATGMDALSHAIETYVSSENSPFSDSLALHAIDIISTHLRDAVRDGANMEARGQLLIASTMAGLAFSNGFLGIVHALSHAVGGKFAVHHGTLNAIFLPPVMRFNSNFVPDRYVRIAKALGVNAGGRSNEAVVADGIASVHTLTTECGLPTTLREVGVTEGSLPELATTALVDIAIYTNPQPATEEQLLEMLYEVW